MKNPSKKADALKLNNWSDESTQNMVSAVLEAFTRIDYSVNCVGVRYLSYIGY